MKKILLLLLSLPVASASFGQAITISSADMPIPTGSYNVMTMTNPVFPANPIPGTNIMWEYGAYDGVSLTEDYMVETDTAFTNAGVDVKYNATKSIAPGFYYNVVNELDFNTANVKVAGMHVPAQSYDLSSYTTNAGDSMIIPDQKHLFSISTEVVRFPFTAGSSWHTVSRRVTDVVFNVVPFFDHTPSQHVYYVHRTDTIVGWGKMRVYTAAGPSMYYDVLMDKISEYAVDSFYIGGLPATPVVLGTIGAAQDQHNDSACYYNFYRKGSFNYLVEFDYKTDTTYSYINGAYVHKDNIMTSGINDDRGTYSTIIYPNPATGNELNVVLSGANIDLAAYAIFDITGKLITTATLSSATSTQHIPLSDKLNNGAYILHMSDKAGAVVIKEQFTIAR